MKDQGSEVLGIPNGITREDVLKAIHDFAAGVRSGFGPSTYYDLVFEGQKYPPKAIVGLAARRLAGRMLRPDEFSGGEESKCFRVLRDLGFEIQEKQNPSYFLLRSNESSPYGDQLGVRYHFSASVPNHKKLLAGGHVVVDRKTRDGTRLVGFGRLASAVTLESASAGGPTEYDAAFAEWKAFDSQREIPSGLLARVRALTGYNVQHAIRPITSDIYTALIDNADRSHWLFQANPEIFDIRSALDQHSEMSWTVNQYPTEFSAGQAGFIWESGPKGGLLARATLISDPTVEVEEEWAREFYKQNESSPGPALRVRLRIDAVRDKPVPRATVRSHPELGDLRILRLAASTNYVLNEREYRALSELFNSDGEAVVEDLARIASAFASTLRASNIGFGRDHDALVRSFICALASKPFVILTGLSGSGKTQIAIRFGEWLGGDRVHVSPVRPDWTGAEALFGYEDVLRPAQNGVAAWSVPDALAFLLRAANDPSNPYALVLDEMNLAHVERYFADVLSGMESGMPCLPNLTRGGDGHWRLKEGAPSRIPFPQNIFVIGTVNVDETTYMFSPKVLDRANTFEFRVQADDLSTAYQKPTPAKSGASELIRGFLKISQNSQWHLAEPYPELVVLTGHLQRLHSILSDHQYEFGHRVFYESTRFAAMYSQADPESSVRSILDRIVMQKILPRLHGSRRRLEGLLSTLAFFAYELPADRPAAAQIAAFDATGAARGNAALPIAFDKLQRMLGALRANQFTSFTE